MIDHYQTLGVARNSTIEDIKKAYKTLALQFHPDHYPGDSSKFLEIQEAYQFLLKNHQAHKNDSAFTSMFSDMFKTMKKEPVKNHVIRLDIDLDDAIDGIEKTLNLKFDIPCGCPFVTRDRCKKCGGLGYVVEEKVGVFLFNKIGNQAQTYVYKNYHKGINLHIKVDVMSKGDFYLKKDVIYSDVPLNIFKAILGGSLEVKTPRSVAIIEIPEGMVKDFSYRLKEKGLPGKDLVINFKVFLPKNLTLQHKKLLNIIIDENIKK